MPAQQTPHRPEIEEGRRRRTAGVAPVLTANHERRSLAKTTLLRARVIIVHSTSPWDQAMTAPPQKNHGQRIST
ncbi:hypothetical protein roselon_01175 [Roseibacterium elongatum DSM 19469]|uniref:Uncharacterized protein n=1 Tax=Roseicyclus elongatus DSM 19469 TaxID=1294273 RepID=W8S453_9RHOB|nr:hypothetical protein roselon_01175 [Roseibacterium elongatum DSM 19469]